MVALTAYITVKSLVSIWGVLLTVQCQRIPLLKTFITNLTFEGLLPRVNCNMTLIIVKIPWPIATKFTLVRSNLLVGFKVLIFIESLGCEGHLTELALYRFHFTMTLMLVSLKIDLCKIPHLMLLAIKGELVGMNWVQMFLHSINIT